MNSKLYLTIVAIIAILYAIGFLLIPESMGTLYGAKQDPNAILNIRFFGSALLAWGVIAWFARDFQDWNAVRGVLIGTAIGDLIGGDASPDERSRLGDHDPLRLAADRRSLLPFHRPRASRRERFGGKVLAVSAPIFAGQ
jgi:hypothetical protein